MMAKLEIDVEILRNLLRYNPDTGQLFWLKRDAEFFKDGKQSAEHSCKRWNSRYAGKQAFTAVHNAGYFHGRILGIYYLAHRVILAMETGSWPTSGTDHANGIRSDNRLVNLKKATQEENTKNSCRPKTNTSGVIGVSWDSVNGKWRASISDSGRVVNLGRFVKKSDAIEIRRKAEVDLGYHPNHGR
jgi:hypothetical protein